MIIGCTNKGCFAQEEHLLNEADDTVYCLKCHGVVNVPRTTKATLRTLKQLKRPSKKGLSFQCQHCKVIDRPLLKTLANKVTVAVCKSCGQVLENVPAPFIEALKIVGPEMDGNEDVDGKD